MRSHPYTAPPPLPPILGEFADELAAILPNQGGPRRRSSFSSSCNDGDIPLSELDPDTSRLLPVRRKRHHVRVQGRLALVRSVSTVNLRAGTGAGTGAGGPSIPAIPVTPRFESAVGSAVVKTGAASRRRKGGRRRRSLDDGLSDEKETEEEERETARRDRQLRGYGIGGVGNIRRPTDVANFASSSRMNSLLLFSAVGPSPPTSITSPDKGKWNIREFLGLAGDRRGKGKSSSP